MQPTMNDITPPVDENVAAEPTGEVRGTLLTPDQVSDWGNEVTIIEPTSVNELGKSTTEQEPEESSTEEAEVEEVVETVEEPVYAPQVEDPGEYAPNDYSFDVTVYDEEGKNGRTVKVSSIDQFEDLLEKDSNFGNAASLLKAQRLATKMETAQERDLADYTAKKAIYDEQVASVAHQTETLNTMAAEIEYLVGRGDLPPVDAKYKDANWADKSVANQPGVKEQRELLAYMRDENAKRISAGLAPMTSVLDAYNAWQIDQSREVQQTNKQKAADQRKAAGARVARSTPNAPTGIQAPPGIAVGRGGSLNDLGNAGWN